MKRREITINLGSLSDEQIELVFDGVIMAHDLLDKQGYKSGDIVDGLTHAAEILNTCRNVAIGRHAAWNIGDLKMKYFDTTKEGGK